MKKLVLILGRPGSGKSTLCSSLARSTRASHIAAGQLLREESHRGSEIGRVIRACIECGESVPDDIIVTLLNREILAATEDVVLIDGFPKSLDALEEWKKTPPGDIACTLTLHCPESICLSRALLRGGRSDDNPYCLSKRMARYNASEASVLQYLRGATIVVDIDTAVDTSLALAAAKRYLVYESKLLRERKEDDSQCPGECWV